MKTPKTTKVSPNDKFSGTKLGKVKKSAFNVSNKKLSALSNIKNTEQALDVLKKNKDNVNIKIGKKKDKTKPKEFSESPREAPLPNSPFTKKKSPKGKKGKGILNGSATSDKGASKKNKPVDPENNSSPVKVNVENKKVKLPFKLDDSLNILTPQKSNTNKDKSPKTNSSPEVLLGIELEKALSPKSEKEKKKLLSKKNIPNKDILNDASAQDNISKKKNKRKKRMSKETSLNPVVSEVDKTVNQIPEKGGEKNKSKNKIIAETTKANTAAEPGSQEKSGKKKRRRRKWKRPADLAIAEFSLFEEINAKNALKALLKVTKTNQKGEKDLFGEDKFIYLQINLLKGSDKSKAVFHVYLPHMILPENPDVCLITPDLKGNRNDPDEAIDFYQDLLRKKGIDFISEIIPIRKLKKEYTSFEHRMKLANRLDAVLVDGRVSKFARLGRRFARTKKCISNVQLDQNDLKTEFDKALRRVSMFSSGRGLSFSIKCGRVGMSVNDIAENIMAIGKHLAADKVIVGNQKNIGSVFVKTALSESFPIYVSLTNPNEVKIPEGKKRKVEEPIEDEISTVLGANVVVHPSGNVRVKKLKTDSEYDEELANHKSKAKVEEKKKGPIGKTKTTDSSDEEEDSEQVLDSDEDEDGDEDLDLKLLASSKLDSDDEDDDSEFDVDEDGEDDDDDTASEINASDDSDGSDLEDQIVAAEREYLEEVRRMQDTIAKKKRDIAKQAPSKPVQNQGKKAQVQKNDKKQDSPKSGSSENAIKTENKQKKKKNKPGLGKPENQQKKTEVEGIQQKKSVQSVNQPQGGKNQQNRKRPANNSSSSPEKDNKADSTASKKGKFEKSGDGKKVALGKKPFQGGKKFKSK